MPLHKCIFFSSLSTQIQPCDFRECIYDDISLPRILRCSVQFIRYVYCLWYTQEHHQRLPFMPGWNSACYISLKPWWEEEGREGSTYLTFGFNSIYRCTICTNIYNALIHALMGSNSTIGCSLHFRIITTAKNKPKIRRIDMNPNAKYISI